MTGDHGCFSVREAATAEDLDACALIRGAVYITERRILPTDRLDHGRELDEWDSTASRSFLSVDENGVGAGTFRLLIAAAGTKLPIEEHFDVQRPEGARYAELSRLAVLPEYRSRSSVVMLSLIRAVHEALLQEVIDVAFAVVEPRLLRMLLAFGFPFEQIGEPARLPDDPYLTVPLQLVPSRVMACLAASPVARSLNLPRLFARPFGNLLSTLDLTQPQLPNQRSLQDSSEMPPRTQSDDLHADA